MLIVYIVKITLYLEKGIRWWLISFLLIYAFQTMRYASSSASTVMKWTILIF